MSEIISWDDKYLIGFEAIDLQHKKSVEHLNSYYELLVSRQENNVIDNEINTMLNVLVEYSNYHFSEEEEIMNSIEGVDFSSHFEEHNGFRLRISEFKAKMSLGEDISYELFYFMKDWLLTHILFSDQKIGKLHNKDT